MVENVRVCADCGRSAAEAAKLLARRAGAAGPFICDACVASCANAIADTPTRIPGTAHPCAFCGKGEDQVAVIIAAGSKMICDECVDAFTAQLKGSR